MNTYLITPKYKSTGETDPHYCINARNLRQAIRIMRATSPYQLKSRIKLVLRSYVIRND